MIERHWHGIAAYCHPDNKVSLGLVEGLNNKIRVIQRSAYGYRDEAYLKLKIIASFLPALPESAHLDRSEEHTSELQSLMRISYAVFCLKKNKQQKTRDNKQIIYHNDKKT